MTAPRRPEPPVVVRCEQRSVVVKWYPGSPGGAHKYCLQARLVEGLDGIGTAHNNNMPAAMDYSNRAGAVGACSAAGGGGVGGRKRRAAWGPAGDGGGTGGGEWVTVYEGVDSTAKVKKKMPSMRHAVAPCCSTISGSIASVYLIALAMVHRLLIMEHYRASIRFACLWYGRRLPCQVTGLAANSVYHFRVRAVNLRSVPSEWSLPAQAATSLRRAAGGDGGGGWDGKVGSLLSRPQNAAEVTFFFHH